MLGSKLRTLFVLGAMCLLAPFAMAETPRYLDYCCSEITPPPANYGKAGFSGVIVDSDSENPACYKTISSAIKAVRSGGTVWVKPNNEKTYIESLNIRKPVKIRPYDSAEVQEHRRNKGGRINTGCKPPMPPNLNLFVEGKQRQIANLRRQLRDIKSKDQIKDIEDQIASLEAQIAANDSRVYYRIQPVSGQKCAKVSLKNWKGTAEISGASFVPPPFGETRRIDCIHHTAGNLVVTDSVFEGASDFATVSDYTAIVVDDGSATILRNGIYGLKSGVVVNHKPNIYDNKVSYTPYEREIIISDNKILFSLESAITILAPVGTKITNNTLSSTFGRAPVERVAFAGITTYGRGPICGNRIEYNPIGIVHYGSGEIRDNMIVQNGTGISLRIDNQKPDEKFQLFGNTIAGSTKVGLAAPRGSIQEHDADYIAALYEQGREEEIYKNDRGDSTYFRGNNFCNRKNVFRMKDLPPGARSANLFKGRRGFERKCQTLAPAQCSATY